MDLPPDIAFLDRAELRDALPRALLEEAAWKAAEQGCDASRWLIANERIDERLYHYLLAEHLGLPYGDDEPSTPDGPAHSSSADSSRPDLIVSGGTVRVSPRASDIEALGRAAAVIPAFARKVVVTPASRIRAARRAGTTQERLDEALNKLAAERRDVSAQRVLTSGQQIVLIATCMALVAGLIMMPGVAVFVAHVTFSLFFLGCVLLRVAMIGTQYWRRRLPRIVRHDALPTYSILVALHDEGDQVPDLVRALGDLDWPRAKLDIKLVCEADDRNTLEAIERCGLPPFMEVVHVPPSQPRTKPKALSFALPLVRGEYVVLYDAEDRPDRGQLRAAYSAFQRADERTACVQARLVIDNAEASLLTRMFAIEYAVLFDGLLPALSRLGGPVPLGGTSNHIRTEALREVGGWDPYNVTEDADLGIRLRRHGYRTATIRSPTFEEAPARFGPWFRQRTRWLKGWMQTSLVHMRRPVHVWRELGTLGFLVFLFFSMGLPLVALAHVVYAAQITVRTSLWLLDVTPLWLGALDVIDFAIVIAGYAAFLVLASRILPLRGHSALLPYLVFLPLYWIAISVAAWRALWQLTREPHRWEKTPHGLSKRPSSRFHPAE